MQIILLILVEDVYKRQVEGSGHFKDMKSFEELQAAWDKAIRELTRVSVIVENAVDIAGEREIPDILCSALTQDCIGRGKTIKEGGAIYDLSLIHIFKYI